MEVAEGIGSASELYLAFAVAAGSQLPGALGSLIWLLGCLVWIATIATVKMVSISQLF